MRRMLILAAVLLGVAACQPPTPGSDEASGDILTVYGEIGTVDRGPVDPVTEPLFGAFGMEFDAACLFNWASLTTLEQHLIETDFPLGGPVRRFSGPLLRDVLAIANPRGDRLIVTALDGYQREIELDRVLQHDVILALRMDGQPLGIGGFGPAMLVWPRGSDPALADMPDDDWLWGVFAIELVSAASQ
ncbi:molybdopterin-dependent oxidoreductase [Maricaulis salignorans]|uniref:Oxidoreductase molybdopterin binding domain-containing protein n=1 Tax=Maricaulis salignorans TaxID=144026 RepID=A0A1G9UY64_9PROT|nr:molybdopterin-dependent oxidoreductase [Maricaulis salignorans]SDM64904.1 Oxidoreductase molybdopterin binding domain-containing protein [Maricaulis salignorans]